ncbi:hypothetical protein HMI49_13830 [Corallococcus exercitus]|uniref:Uncharacterized protein n=1 Tax=Corallococcus exercitus TaxID=2316736 RepID=A0A7Y4KI95_9BACT|nr:hypothetical protein [Corallococcus exercitus]NOK34277.1 hypothetical protein [Corallococcus exercitus]
MAVLDNAGNGPAYTLDEFREGRRSGRLPETEFSFHRHQLMRHGWPSRQCLPIVAEEAQAPLRMLRSCTDGEASSGQRQAPVSSQRRRECDKERCYCPRYWAHALENRS